MTKARIYLEDVHLHYAATAYKERSLKNMLTGMFKPRRSRKELVDIHALKGISVTIDEGERVGLIGHNGAGKSTFLKMVAGLYPASSGRREIKGTVRSLFDISLGFEPEASGRENILYRGLLLGLTPKFMRSIEEEVVEFADIGEFIDYPIKTYSAGMQVRLAFAISTAVGGEILLLDEVMGAGDAMFMEKAKRRIYRLVEQSEIMILASHDTSTLKSTCQRVLVFDAGRIIFDGPVVEALELYAQRNESKL